MRRGRFRMELIATLFAVCGWPTIGASADSPPLDGTGWLLTSLGGRAPPTEATATARFDGGRVQGTNGCNRYSAPVVIHGANVEISPKAATTNMACAPDLMKLADAFMMALVSARSYRISSHQLELLGADGTVLATFAAQSQSLTGTSWRVTGINNGRGGVVSLVAGTNVTMSFATGGKVAGSGGCNDYTSTYTQHGGKLTFASAMSWSCAQQTGRSHCHSCETRDPDQGWRGEFASLAPKRTAGTTGMTTPRLYHHGKRGQ